MKKASNFILECKLILNAHIDILEGSNDILNPVSINISKINSLTVYPTSSNYIYKLTGAVVGQVILIRNKLQSPAYSAYIDNVGTIPADLLIAAICVNVSGGDSTFKIL